jgi:hypothetical protein
MDRIVRPAFGWAHSFVQTGRVNAPHGAGYAMRGIHNPRALGFRQVGANCQCPAAVLFDFVRAEDFERILMIAINHWSYRVERELRLHDYSPKTRSGIRENSEFVLSWC